MRPLTRQFSNLTKSVPLRFILVVPFILQISLAVGLTGWVSIRNGQRAVNEVASQLRSETTAQIQQYLETYIATPHLINRLNANAIQLGQLDLQDLPSLERHLWHQIQAFDTVTQIQFGTQQREHVAVERLDDGSFQTKIAGKSTGNRIEFYALDRKGDRIKQINSKPNYDPRVRPWYKVPVKAGKATWGKIYKRFATPKLAVDAGLPIYKAPGNLLGVASVDCSLSGISKFLHSLRIGKTGEAFIIERSGLLVGSSTTQTLFTIQNQAVRRFKATESRDVLIQLAAQSLLKNFGDFTSITGNQQLDFEIDGKRQFLQVVPLNDRRGLDWLIVVVVPEADFMAQIHANTHTTILLCLAAFGLATVLGVFTSGWLAQPILRLSRATRAVANGDLNQTVAVNGVTEIEVLAQSFNQMAQQLRESFAALSRTNEELEVRVEQRTTELREKNERLQQEMRDRQEAEAALRHSEQKYRNIFENSQVGIGRTRLEDGLFLDVNQRYAEMMGCGSPKDLIGSRFTSEFYANPSDRQHILAKLEQQGEIRNFEEQLRRCDGSISWVLLSLRLNVEEGCIDFVIADISDRKRAEEALRTSEEKFASAFRSSSHPLTITTFAEGRFIEVNDSFCHTTGYSLEEVIGHTSTELNLFKNPNERSQMIELLKATGAIRDREMEIRTKSGEVRTALFSAEVIDLNGQTCILWVSNDITERKQAEADLQQAMEAAKVANLAKSQFLSNMSHELRTPLNVILGFTQLMTRNGLLTQQQHSYMDTIGRSGEHLLALINDVLEMSKIEAGRTTLNESDFDLYGLLDSLQQMLRLKAESKGLQLTFNLANDLPHYIRTDESKLRQVLMNLLGNAIKFTQVGSVTLRVSVCSRRGIGNEEEQPSIPYPLHFEVEDTGPGIASTEFETLFEPFVQTEAGRNSQEGTGLGLPISQKFVRLMGGEITVLSQRGEGTIFKFDIQIYPVDADQVQEREPSRQVSRLEAGQPNYRILVAEDKPENRRLLVELLTPIGFEVREAINGKAAIDIWQSWSPHLIWMDIRMPVMDGFEATKQIKATGTQAPAIIALTGSAFEEDRIIALSIGFDDFVRKPFRAEVIFEKMAEYLGVRYLYAPQLDSGGAEDSSLPQSLLQPDELREALARMPIDWVEQLHSSATKVNAKQILKLIEQIPASNAPLANTLTHMVNQFCFEALVNLIRNS